MEKIPSCRHFGWQPLVKIDPKYYRPTEVDLLIGDPAKAKAKLGWEPKITLQELVSEMVQSDYTSAKRDSLVKLAGFQAYEYAHAYHELNLKLTTGAYGSTFFMLTGFHGFFDGVPELLGGHIGES